VKYLTAVSRAQHLKVVNLHLPEVLLEGIEELVRSKVYPNRSEAVRVAVRDLLKTELWETKPGEAARASYAPSLSRHEHRFFEITVKDAVSRNRLI